MPLCTNQGFKSVVPPSGLSSTFLYWYLMHATPLIDSMASGTTFKEISKRPMQGVPLPIPPAAEQGRIVASIEAQLSQLDFALAALEAVSRKTAVLRTAYLREGFRLDVPLKALGDVANVVSGQTPKGLATAESGTIPLFKVGDMNLADGGILYRSRTMLSDRSVQKLKLHLRPPGTVVFPKRGGAIATNKKRVLGCLGAFDLNTMGVIAGQELDARFLRWWFETVDLASLADGSNVPQINHGDIRPLRIPMPPLDEQRRIVATFDELEDGVLRLSSVVESARSRIGALGPAAD